MTYVLIALPLIAIIAVSYTHLDVYKRQVVFCNAPEDNPFMAGAFHGPGEPDCVINVGVSGPGVAVSYTHLDVYKRQECLF